VLLLWKSRAVVTVWNVSTPPGDGSVIALLKQVSGFFHHRADRAILRAGSLTLPWTVPGRRRGRQCDARHQNGGPGRVGNEQPARASNGHQVCIRKLPPSRDARRPTLARSTTRSCGLSPGSRGSTAPLHRHQRSTARSCRDWRSAPSVRALCEIERGGIGQRPFRTQRIGLGAPGVGVTPRRSR